MGGAIESTRLFSNQPVNGSEEGGAKDTSAFLGSVGSACSSAEQEFKKNPNSDEIVSRFLFSAAGLSLTNFTQSSRLSNEMLKFQWLGSILKNHGNGNGNLGNLVDKYVEKLNKSNGSTEEIEDLYKKLFTELYNHKDEVESAFLEYSSKIIKGCENAFYFQHEEKSLDVKSRDIFNKHIKTVSCTIKDTIASLLDKKKKDKLCFNQSVSHLFNEIVTYAKLIKNYSSQAESSRSDPESKASEQPQTKTQNSHTVPRAPLGADGSKQGDVILNVNSYGGSVTGSANSDNRINKTSGRNDNGFLSAVSGVVQVHKNVLNTGKLGQDQVMELSKFAINAIARINNNDKTVPAVNNDATSNKVYVPEKSKTELSPPPTPDDLLANNAGANNDNDQPGLDTESLSRPPRQVLGVKGGSESDEAQTELRTKKAKLLNELTRKLQTIEGPPFTQHSILRKTNRNVLNSPSSTRLAINENSPPAGDNSSTPPTSDDLLANNAGANNAGANNAGANNAGANNAGANNAGANNAGANNAGANNAGANNAGANNDNGPLVIPGQKAEGSGNSNLNDRVKPLTNGGAKSYDGKPWGVAIPDRLYTTARNVDLFIKTPVQAPRFFNGRKN